VPELEVRERPPSMLRIVDGRPPRGVGDGGLEVGDVNGGPLGGADGRSDSGHHQS
jgi:hypothetical protein